jgi:Fur family ferric uptake transcriptional regulator
MARVTVLEYLAANQQPMSHGDIAEALFSDGLDRATVYRNLMDLSDAGIVERTDLGDHVWRFELRKSDDEHGHPHFMCTECGSIACLGEDVVQIVATRAAPRAIAKREVAVHIKGRCDSCAARERRFAD